MKTVIEMAQEAGIEFTCDPTETPPRTFVECWMEELERFAELVCADAIAEEREACAKVCESLFDMDDDSCNEAEKCAAAIRARGQHGT